MVLILLLLWVGETLWMLAFLRTFTVAPLSDRLSAAGASKRFLSRPVLGGSDRMAIELGHRERDWMKNEKL